MLFMKKNKSFLFYFLIILVTFIIRLAPHVEVFSQKFNFQAIDKIYQQSQFAENPSDRKVTIQDWDLYPYAGFIYLTRGELNQVNIEHPPLGKYLFGLSILIFGNTTIIQIPLALIFLLLCFLISVKVLRSKSLALLVPLGVIFEKSFVEQTTHSLLDLFQSTMVALSIWLVISKKLDKKVKVFLGLTLGAVASIKYPAVAIILTLSFIVHLAVIKGKGKINQALGIVLIAILFYLLTYAPLFLQQGMGGFINLQIKALKMHLSHVPEYKPFAPLKVMFLNQWPVWWDKTNPIHQTGEWNILWPFLGTAMLLSPLFCWLYKIKTKSNLIIFLFSWFYFIFINSRLFFPSYLFLILPYLYLFLLWEIKLIYHWLKKSVL